MRNVNTCTAAGVALAVGLTLALGAPPRARALLAPARPLPVARADGALAYTCEGLPAEVPLAAAFTAAHTADAAAARAAADAALALEAAGHARGPDWLRDAALALAGMRAVDIGALTLKDRLLAQNGAYRLAGVLDGLARPTKLATPAPLRTLGRLRDDAVALVDALALPGAAFAAMGAAPDAALERWLGPRAGWVERRTEACGETLLVHERANDGALAFHPFRGGPTRALVAQVVGFDRDRRAHVTPLVATIELRRGLAARAPACVVELDAPRGVLAPVAHAALEPSMFIRPVAHGGIGCTACHGSETAFGAADVPDAAAAAALADARRAHIVGFATAALGERARGE
ncbi:MAG TPA: hypothetical protein VG389_07620 [Myxococcota bacterium]|jgi:hypothetical protein|nr:hypothetical protein [Myxococcota bacterium]